MSLCPSLTATGDMTFNPSPLSFPHISPSYIIGAAPVLCVLCSFAWKMVNLFQSPSMNLTIYLGFGCVSIPSLVFFSSLPCHAGLFGHQNSRLAHIDVIFKQPKGEMV
jgi:hypothetical protein